MKKYILVIMFSIGLLISLILPIQSHAETAAPDGASGGTSTEDTSSSSSSSQNAETAAPDGASGGTSTEDTSSSSSSSQNIEFKNPIRFRTIPELIAGIINALLGILGAITVAVLVMSGFKYMTSSNPGEVGQALDGIKNAVIGLIIIMGAFLITQYVITALAV